jgi:hypothetical protein
MKTFKWLSICFTFLTFFSCTSDDDASSQQQDLQDLAVLRMEIENLATSVVCEDSTSWTYTDIGGKACGGPTGYIAYPISINVDEFLKKVEEFNIAEDNFNKKWNIRSDCSVPPQPVGVNCENGVAVLVFP